MVWHGEFKMHVGGDAALQELHESTAELGGVRVGSLFRTIGVTVPYRLDHRGVVGSDIPYTVRLEHLVFEMNMQHAPAFIK